MKNNSANNNALNLLREFIVETPQEDLKIFVDKFRKLDIAGPTFADYLNKLAGRISFLLSMKRW